MEKLKLLKGEVEKILQENHTSKENRLAFANGVIYALANVTTGLKGKERFLRDYAEGILHAADVLYEKKDDSGKVEEYILVYTTNTDCGYKVDRCSSREEAEELMKQQALEEMREIKREFGYLPTLVSYGGSEAHVVFRENADDELPSDEVSQYRIYKI